MGVIYRGRRVLVNIGKSRENFNKNGKLRCFNYNIYKHIAKNCQKSKKKKETRKCYKYNKVGHFAKDCRLEQKIKNRSIQEELDNGNNDKQESFVRGLEQVWYDKPLYIVISKIDTLFYIDKTTKKGN